MNTNHDAGENDSGSGNCLGGSKGSDCPSRVGGTVVGRVGGCRDLIGDPVKEPNPLEGLEGSTTEDSGKQVNEMVLC